MELRRGMMIPVVVAAFLAPTTQDAHALAAGGLKRIDPAELVPMGEIPPQHRDEVADVIRNHQLHRRGPAETFPANPRIYLSLLGDPVLTLSLWKDLSGTPAQLMPSGPNRYLGSDGAGTSAEWEYVTRLPQLHILMCKLDYVSPRGAARLQGRIVLLVRSGYFREVDGESWVQQEVEAFVKVDSRGWKAVAATLRPFLDKVLEDQVKEAGWFVSLMARMVEAYPDWALGVTQRQPILSEAAKGGFAAIVAETRKPGASNGRPLVNDVAVAQEEPQTRRR
jgi:hypothetical protein